MDPNLFHVDWDRLAEALATIVVLSFFVERSLALVFEHRWFVERFKGRGLKEPIAFGLAFMVCGLWQFDAISVVVLAEKTSLLGYVITAAVIAGGSKASIKLFHDVMGAKSTAQAAQVKKKAVKKEGEAGDGE